MSGFNKITADAFEKLQFGAGIVCKTFDPAKPAAVADHAILFATSGGIKFEAKPTYKDYGEDIDNCPKNMKELKRLDSWEATLSGTALTIDTASATQVTGAADASGNKVAPRNDVKLTDFSDVWWVGNYGEGGCAAVHLINALSTDGFSLQTGDKAKGQFPFAFTGHYSIDSQDTPPFELYIVKTSTAVAHAADEGSASDEEAVA